MSVTFETVVDAVPVREAADEGAGILGEWVEVESVDGDEKRLKSQKISEFSPHYVLAYKKYAQRHECYKHVGWLLLERLHSIVRSWKVSGKANTWRLNDGIARL